MTTQDRVQAVADYGFTERQARFLVLVMRHAGVCVKRQYAAFAGIANGGEKCNAFFEKLVSRGYAVASACVHNRARLYHVHHKAERFMSIGAARSGGPVPQTSARRAGGHKTVWTEPRLGAAMGIESGADAGGRRDARRWSAIGAMPAAGVGVAGCRKGRSQGVKTRRGQTTTGTCPTRENEWAEDRA